MLAGERNQEKSTDQRKQRKGENKNKTSGGYCNHFIHPRIRTLRSTGKNCTAH
jgi:hypothetical protein